MGYMKKIVILCTAVSLSACATDMQQVNREVGVGQLFFVKWGL
jgi:hypothetical protein